MPPLLEARGVSKEFPGVLALNEVRFDLRPGEIHALCGENGAGKSTLIKLISGIHPHGSYRGELRIEGKPVELRCAADAERAGIAVIYQELAVVPEMTIAENLFLGCEPTTRGGLIDWGRIHRDSQELLRRFQISLSPATRVGGLGTGQKQLLEILKALRKQSRILILDEPTAALAGVEVRVLLDALRELRRRGIGCIYISHRLEEVFAVADRITVLRDGASIATLETAQTTKSEVIRHMVGREIKDFFPRRPSRLGPALMRVEDLRVADPDTERVFLDGISFEVHAGEVLGFGGLMGSGRTELMMHLFGAWGRRLGGIVELEGKPLRSVFPGDAMTRGLTLVTEDRRRYGLFLEQDIGFNLSLSNLKRLVHWFCIHHPKEFAANRSWYETLRIKAPTLESMVAGLSGGNQQKVVIGKALMTEPKLVCLDEPTRGIDVGAKLEVYEIINRLTDRGQAILLVSSELPELLGMSDRIVMLHQGRVGGVFKRREATQEKLMAAALGHIEA